MNHFEPQVPIILDGWDRLILPLNGRLVSIPDPVMLDELVRPPQPYKILPLLVTYKVSEKEFKDVWEIIHSKQRQPSWKLITHALRNTESERLYIVSSQNAYRIPRLNNIASCKADLESQKKLQSASNSVVRHLRIKFSYIFEDDLKVKEICDKTDFYFETYVFLMTVARYCNFILPYPYATRLDREENSHDCLRKPIEMYGNKEREIVNNEAAFHKRLKERFSTFSYTSVFMQRFFEHLELNDSLSSFTSELFDRHDYLTSKIRKTAREKRKTKSQRSEKLHTPSTANLHQCVFCYRFSFVKLPLQGDDFTQHCARNECKRAYGSWVRHVNRLGIRVKGEKIDGWSEF
jgi:hypothetical protein